MRMRRFAVALLMIAFIAVSAFAGGSKEEAASAS